MQRILDLIGLDTSAGEHAKDITDSEFFGFPLASIIEAEETLRSNAVSSVAYFSMEYGLAPSIYHTFKTTRKVSDLNTIRRHEVFSNMTQMDYYHYLPVEKILDLPIYSGGLGVLAGDSLKSCADLGLSIVGVGILWHKGYFRQRFWFRGGGQFPEELSWDPESYPGLIPLKNKIEVELSGHKIVLKLWKYYVYSYDLKKVIPLILIDANTQENPEYMRELTSQLYRSHNSWIKLAQRIILGIGGIKALESLGYSLNKYHLNEGHAAFAYVEKACLAGSPRCEAGRQAMSAPAADLKDKFAYTCHTPVEAGHDRFNFIEVEAALGHERCDIVRGLGTDARNPHLANLTLLAMNASSHVNGVSKKHGEVTRLQFPSHAKKIESITNGVHTHTWMSDATRSLLRKYEGTIGSFITDPTQLANVVKLRNDPAFRSDLWNAHHENKAVLSEILKHWFIDKNVFTISWARRFANYKRPTLILQNVDRLVKLANEIGQIQIIIAGKAHPEDQAASYHMDSVMEKINQLGGHKKNLRICFLENYDTYFAKLLTSGVDVWLNNPLPPFEASGTSGMKAIINGVLQLSTLDGWVVEAADKNIGKIFGYAPKEGEIGSEAELRLEEDSKALYDSLETMMKLYYDTLNNKVKKEESQWIDMMINCIEQSAYFSTHRMIREYNDLIWKT